MKTPRMILLFVSILTYSASALAWSQHGLLTKLALSEVRFLDSLTVTYEPLEVVIPRMKLYYDTKVFGPAAEGGPAAAPVATPAELNLYLRIKRDSRTHHGFVFLPKLAEKPSQNLPAVSVLSMYADEPDGWSDTPEGHEPDTELFDESQYGPILWRAEFSMMGGRQGRASQSFRHMWWSPWNLSHPIATFKLPFSELKKPMGEAHERLDTYLRLSRLARDAGSRYWQLRFLANGLHYLQDCTQAFHVSQSPTKKFIYMASRLGGYKGGSFELSEITKRTTNIISYYHWAYEEYIGRIFLYPARFPKAYQEFKEALVRSPRTIDSTQDLLIRVAKDSINRSPEAAKTAMGFFPKIPKAVDLTTFDPRGFMNDAWWAQVDRDSERASKAQRRYFESVRDGFRLFGESVRLLVQTELTR